MSILIKDMELPKNCYGCDLANFLTDETPYCRRTMRVVVPTIKRPDWCPLVEVPPHGRLIDADALIEKDNKDYEAVVGMTDPLTVFGTALSDAHTAIQEFLKDAPTVIEAEEDDHEKT